MPLLSGYLAVQHGIYVGRPTLKLQRGLFHNGVIVAEGSVVVVIYLVKAGFDQRGVEDHEMTT